MNEHDERRLHVRVPFHATIDLDFRARRYQGCETENLSTTGVLVLGISDRQLGESCDLILHLTGSSDNLALTMRGEVAHLEENGIGIHFSGMDLDSYTHLRNIIYYNADDPDSLDEIPFDHE